MSSEIERPGIEGKVITGGLAQSVTRENGVVRIRLTQTGPHLPHEQYGGMMKIAFPEPVTVKGGEVVMVDIESLPEPDREQAGQPMRVPSDSVITDVTTGPSMVRPGTTQAAIGHHTDLTKAASEWPGPCYC